MSVEGLLPAARGPETRPLSPSPPRRNRGLGSGSTAGGLAAIPQPTIARSHPDRTAQARAPGPPWARAPGLGGRGGGAGAARQPSLATQKVRAGEVPSGNGAAMSQGRRRPRTEAGALCASERRSVLRDAARPGAGRKPPLVSESLRPSRSPKPLLPGLPPCPARLQAGLI